MTPLSRRPRSARTLLVAAALALLLLLLLNLDRTPKPLGGEVRKTPARAQAQPSRDPSPSAVAPRAEMPAQQPAPSKFLARLTLGDELQTLRARGESVTAEEVRDRLNDAASRLLRCDGPLIGHARIDLDLLHEPRMLPAMLAAAGKQEAAIVLCSATKEKLKPKEAWARIEEYRQLIEKSGVRPRAVLVLDFVEGGGDGLLWARAFATQSLGSGVAYWYPDALVVR